MKKSEKLIGIALLLISISYIGNARTVNRVRKNQNVKKTAAVKKNTKELNSQEYAQVLRNFQKKAERYLETGDKIRLVDDYINDIENVKVSKKALEDNKKADMEVVEGTLYPLLTRLKNAEILSYRWEESTGGPPRKYYKLTEKGELFIAELDKTWNQLIESVTQITKNQ